SPFDLKQTFRYNGKLARDRREILPALMGALIIDTHSELQSAWRAVIQRGTKAEEVAELGSVPLRGAEGVPPATKQWKNPEFRNLKKIEWQSWAQQKYRRVAQP